MQACAPYPAYFVSCRSLVGFSSTIVSHSKPVATYCTTLRQEQEPPPPGTASADSKPPPSAVALARREAALVHRVMALLSNDNTKKNADSAASAAESAAENDDKRRELLTLLAEAAADGVDVPRWLGHGRSSNRGRTPLMEAAMQGRTGCTAALAEAACCACGGGARGGGERGLNARNERGWYSALHYACYHGHAGLSCDVWLACRLDLCCEAGLECRLTMLRVLCGVVFRPGSCFLNCNIRRGELFGEVYGGKVSIRGITVSMIK